MITRILNRILLAWWNASAQATYTEEPTQKRYYRLPLVGYVRLDIRKRTA